MGRSFEKSLAWKERAKAALVGGGQPHKQSQPPKPVMVAGAKGAHFWDADGNDYIDYLMGYGPMILGHAYPSVIDTVTKYLVERGNVYNFGHTLEVELAEKLVQIIPSADRVAYFVAVRTQQQAQSSSRARIPIETRSFDVAITDGTIGVATHADTSQAQPLQHLASISMILKASRPSLKHTQMRSPA